MVAAQEVGLIIYFACSALHPKTDFKDTVKLCLSSSPLVAPLDVAALRYSFTCNLRELATLLTLNES